MLIREPRPSDESSWRALWHGYNGFYGVDIPEEVTNEVWRRIVSGTDAVFARFAVDHQLLGFAICILHPFTWSVRPACLLEDLYVDPDHRGAGVGRHLLDAVLAEASHRQWARLYWHTRQDNTTARGLYDSYTPADGFVRYTIDIDTSADDQDPPAIDAEVAP